MKLVIAIVIAIISSCSFTAKENEFKNDFDMKDIGDTTKAKILFFKISDSCFSVLSSRKYIDQCNLQEPFYIEKVNKCYYPKSINVFHRELIYKKDRNKTELIFENIYFKKSIDLKTDLIVSGEKFFRETNESRFSIDTMASYWLMTRNQLRVDSLNYNLEDEEEICGTAQSELLHQGFLYGKTKSIKEDSARQLIRTLKGLSKNKICGQTVPLPRLHEINK